jgi:tetratricopeptide (TPR) repeat protein
MTSRTSPLSLRGRLLRAAAIPAIVVLGATACSSSGGSSSDAAPTTAPSQSKALAALNAGLKAQTAGDLTKAAADYNTTLDYDATNKYAFYNLALIDEASSNYGLAEANYRSAIKSDAKYEPALFNLAILRTGPDPKEAISLYKSAVAANPKDAAAWLNLGLLERANKAVRTGDKDVLKAIALDPSLKDPAEAVKGSGPSSP